MADEHLRVVMLGSPLTAYVFEELVAAEGLTISYAPPVEEHDGTVRRLRYAFEIAGAGSLVCNGTRAAIREAKERFPGIELHIEGDETPPEGRAT
jgi:hypothetical protein